MDKNNEKLIPGDVILRVEEAKKDIIGGGVKVTDAMAN